MNLYALSDYGYGYVDDVDDHDENAVLIELHCDDDDVDDDGHHQLPLKPFYKVTLLIIFYQSTSEVRQLLM